MELAAHHRRRRLNSIIKRQLHLTSPSMAPSVRKFIYFSLCSDFHGDLFAFSNDKQSVFRSLNSVILSPKCFAVCNFICRQCGKPFKPEKMHAHMKSCKGMKAMIAKGTRPEISAKGSQRRSSEFAFDNDSPSGYYLMHQK